MIIPSGRLIPPFLRDDQPWAARAHVRDHEPPRGDGARAQRARRPAAKVEAGAGNYQRPAPRGEVQV